jgi:hypothetical protein
MGLFSQAPEHLGPGFNAERGWKSLLSLLLLISHSQNTIFLSYDFELCWFWVLVFPFTTFLHVFCWMLDLHFSFRFHKNSEVT